VRLDERFDRLPRSHLRLGEEVVPTYFVLGLAGVVAGVLALIAVALIAGLSLLVALALVAIAGFTLVVSTLIRRSLTGTEQLVLLEQFAFVLGAAAVALHLADVPVRPYLDVLAVALAVFLVFGRCGCFLAGCCYGRPAAIGVCYPPECGHHERIRRFPLQLVECVLWLGLAVVAAILTITRTDGSALAATLTGYGVARLALEPLRGDPRPRFLRATEGQWLSLGAIVVGIAIVERELPPTRVAVLAGVALALLLVLPITMRSWFARDRGLGDAERASIRALGPALRETRIDARVTTWRAASLLFAASTLDEKRVLVSVSSPDRPLVRAEAALAFATLFDALGTSFEQEPIEHGHGIFAAQLETSVLGRDAAAR
jgi:prolipoprotein diacylglyceryltransferase